MYHIRGPQEWLDIINSVDNRYNLIESVEYYMYNGPRLVRYKNITPIQKLALDLDFANFKRAVKIFKNE